MTKGYIGIDNGVSGSIGLVTPRVADNNLWPTPTKKEQSYTKKKQQITRVDFSALLAFLRELPAGDSPMVVIERPFNNPTGMKATTSAMRCLEATLIAIELMGWRYQYIDSKEWQKELLPKGIKGTSELKAASRDIGKRLFPNLEEQIDKQKDADALLIAEWARRNRL